MTVAVRIACDAEGCGRHVDVDLGPELGSGLWAVRAIDPASEFPEGWAAVGLDGFVRLPRGWQAGLGHAPEVFCADHAAAS